MTEEEQVTFAIELRALHTRLKQLLGLTAHEVILLGVRLNCRNCKRSRFVKAPGGDEWECKYGTIPKEYIDAGCDSWINRIN